MENVPAATGTGQAGTSPATTGGRGEPGREAVANTSSVSDTGGFDTENKRMHPLVAGFQKLSMMRQLWLMVALAAAVALGFAAIL